MQSLPDRERQTNETFAAHLALVGKNIQAWVDLFAENAVIEFPYASITPRRLEGKEAIYNYMKDVPAQMQDLGFTNVRIYPTSNPNVLFAEVHGEAIIVATGRHYQQDYVMRLETKEGKIIHYREYWNPVPVLEAWGGTENLLHSFNAGSVKGERRSMKIVIAAASGNIGRRAAEKVVQAGAETVLLTRQPEKVADLAAQGATVKPISSDDPQGLIEATQDADALFWLTPPKLDAPSLRDWYSQTAMIGARAVRENGIKRVVNISSLGAGAEANLGTVTFVGTVESIFNESCSNVLHLRPGYFMENFLGQVKFIQQDNAVYFPYDSDHDIPWISTDDIGDEVAKYLLDDRWAGQWTRNLMGAENLTLPEATAILSRLLNRSIKYVQVTVESIQQQFALTGATPDVQQELGKLFRALGNPNGIYAITRTPEATTSTTFEQFAIHKLLKRI